MAARFEAQSLAETYQRAWAWHGGPAAKAKDVQAKSIPRNPGGCAPGSGSSLGATASALGLAPASGPALASGASEATLGHAALGLGLVAPRRDAALELRVMFWVEFWIGAFRPGTSKV